MVRQSIVAYHVGNLLVFKRKRQIMSQGDLHYYVLPDANVVAIVMVNRRWFPSPIHGWMIDGIKNLEFDLKIGYCGQSNDY